MHVHANQINPNAQLDATYSAQKSEAKREAARTRKSCRNRSSKTKSESLVLSKGFSRWFRNPSAFFH